MTEKVELPQCGVVIKRRNAIDQHESIDESIECQSKRAWAGVECVSPDQ